MKDLIGQAIQDYYFNNSPEDIQTESSVSEMDILPVAHLFRNYAEMNRLEKKALDTTYGKVLDVGAAAGPHSLYLQNEKKLAVTALDISPLSIEICRLRGIKKAICSSLLDFNEEKFDTILLLMNGTGIFETFDKIGIYLEKLKTLLNKKGQILIDSTDIIYMYDDLNGISLPLDSYYGEVDYFVYYKGKEEDPMTWLYLDFENLKRISAKHGFKIENLAQDGFAYLARLSLEADN
ncbi:MAG: class I SAM-dependent methyltransferase [Weeksellaceae bacterium]|jgi:SAM-dependent methyltransferase|nr:class I SAM-dependent methyltransferase [Weeksellaceae bacterium]MDX9704233.1 class I SAM-dependent methyltransferase [Weeksellaceae bacterium]